MCPSLREKYPYWEFFWFVFSRIRTEYGEIFRISPYLVWMRKNANQKNSQYGHFSRSALVLISYPENNLHSFIKLFIIWLVCTNCYPANIHLLKVNNEKTRKSC